jgi:hypothetical protein
MAIHRPSAKVLLIDEEGRLLLLRGIDRTKPEIAPWWFPVGGGLETGQWWSVADLHTTTEAVYPDGLADRLAQVLG